MGPTSVWSLCARSTPERLLIFISFPPLKLGTFSSVFLVYFQREFLRMQEWVPLFCRSRGKVGGVSVISQLKTRVSWFPNNQFNFSWLGLWSYASSLFIHDAYLYYPCVFCVFLVVFSFSLCMCDFFVCVCSYNLLGTPTLSFTYLSARPH